MTSSLTGDRKLDRQLDRLANREIRRITRNVTNRGLTVIAKAQRSEAPDKESRKAIGKRFRKNSQTGKQDAKAGVHVAKRRARIKADGSRTARPGPWAHVRALGTTDRYTKRGAFRGKITSDEFVGRGFAKSRAAAQQAIAAAYADQIPKAAAKL